MSEPEEAEEPRQCTAAWESLPATFSSPAEWEQCENDAVDGWDLCEKHRREWYEEEGL